MIELEAVTKIYRMGAVEVRALDTVDLTIDEGDLVAVMGPSGSGKSTMMNILGCLDVPTSGRYRLDGIDVSGLRDRRLADIRPTECRSRPGTGPCGRPAARSSWTAVAT